MSEAHAEAHAEEHAHDINYFKVYITLIVLLVISVVGPMFEIRVITLITAFGIAVVKAYAMERDQAARFAEANDHLRDRQIGMVRASAAMPALMWTTVPPAKSRAPSCASQPSAHTQWQTGA